MICLLGVFLWSIASFSQDENNEDVNSAPEKFVEISNTSTLFREPISFTLNLGKFCFLSGRSCKITIIISTNDMVEKGKYLLKWESLGKENFEMPNGKFFNSDITEAGVAVFIPKQTLIYNKELEGFEAEIKFYDDNNEISEVPSDLTQIQNSSVNLEKPVRFEWDGSRYCFWKGKVCHVIVIFQQFDELKERKKYLIKWEGLGSDNLELPVGRFFKKNETNQEFAIFIPKQNIVYNKELGGFEASLEFYK